MICNLAEANRDSSPMQIPETLISGERLQMDKALQDFSGHAVYLCLGVGWAWLTFEGNLVAFLILS